MGITKHLKGGNLFGVAIEGSEGRFVKNLLNWMELLKKNVKTEETS
jgi:hypothetical protein